MKIKKLIIALLSIVVLMCCQSVNVHGEDTSGNYTLTIKNNPATLEHEVINESFSSYSKAEGKRFKASSTNSFDNQDEAVSYMRECLVKRNETITFSLTYDEVMTEADVKRTCNKLINAAMDHTKVPVEGDYIYWQYDKLRQSCDYKVFSTYTTCNYTFTIGFYTSAEEEAAVEDEVDKVLTNLDIDGADDYHKFMAIYDYLTHNVTYDHEHVDDENYLHQYTAYGALIDHTSVCQGYAVALYRLLLESDVDCRLIPGYANGSELHAWNIVELDGFYYNVDATWDASNINDYRYCLRPDSYFERNHTRFITYTISSFYESYPMYMADYGQSIDVQAEMTLDTESFEYNGTPQKPDVTITIDNKTIDHRYYDVTYPSEFNVGTHTVTADLKGGYNGSASATFEIVPNKPVITLSPSTFVYDGKVKKPDVIVKVNNKTIDENSYVVTYPEAIEVGDYEVNVELKGNYAGSGSTTFTIVPCEPVITLNPSSFVYDGKAKEPDVTVEVDHKIIDADSYMVIYPEAIKVGEYQIGVELKGDYSGSSSTTFTINPTPTKIKKLQKKKKAAKVTWTKKSKEVTGYQIRYSTNSDLSDFKTVTIKNYKTTSKTISKLKKKTKYYFQIRTYKTVKSTKYYSSWSATKSVKTK